MSPMADRISELPDEILLHILSFLPTEDVITTNLVSKRWRPLWLSVPTLDFDHDRYDRRREKQQCGFADFVSATIQARGPHQPIKGFRLFTTKVRYLRDRERRWLNKVIQPGLENFEVECHPEWDVPSNIFSCTTLVSLKLTSASFPYIKDLSSSIYLPSLKTLYLRTINFSQAQYYIELLNGCPILENLEANRVVSYLRCSFQGKFKSLSKLVRAELFDLSFPMLDVNDYECNGEDIPMFPNLIHLELVNVKLKPVLDILNCSPNLEIFVFDFKDSSCEDWPNPQFVPECFSLRLKKCVIANYTGMANQIRFVKYVMQNSTSLLTMTISCSSDDQQKKLQMFLESASCPWSSSTCQLLFK